MLTADSGRTLVSMTSDQQWTNLYAYLDSRFAAVDDRFKAVDSRFEELITIIANLAGRVDDDDTERSAIVAQLDRHEV